MRIFLFLIILDQLTKFLALGVGLPVTFNKGVAFSLLSDVSSFLIFIILLVLVIFLRNGVSRVFISVILAGGVANLIDRLRLGYVIDFIDLKFWPTFNLADVFITIGALGVIYESVTKGYFRR